MSKSDHIKHLQGRIGTNHISTNDYLQKAIARGDAETQRVIKSAMDAARNPEDYETEYVTASIVTLNALAIDQAIQDNEALTKKVDWLLDMIGELLKSHNPKDSILIGKAINKVKQGKV